MEFRSVHYILENRLWVIFIGRTIIDLAEWSVNNKKGVLLNSIGDNQMPERVWPSRFWWINVVPADALSGRHNSSGFDITQRLK